VDDFLCTADYKALLEELVTDRVYAAINDAVSY